MAIQSQIPNKGKLFVMTDVRPIITVKPFYTRQLEVTFTLESKNLSIMDT